MEQSTENNSLLSIINRTVEGKPLLEVHYRGRRCWLLSDIERVLEYAPGALGDLLRREWASEFEEGKHYVVVQGAELVELRKALAEFAAVSHTAANALSPKARSVTLLFYPGLDLVLTKTEKPIGREVRRVLVDDVISSVREKGYYVAPSAALPPPDTSRLLELQVRDREARLKQAEYMDRAVLLLEAQGTLSQPARVALAIGVAELATGERLGKHRPVLLQDGWKQPTQIAAELGVTPARVGRVITALGLRERVEGLAASHLTVAENSDRTVPVWTYSPAAVERIKAHLAAGKGATP